MLIPDISTLREIIPTIVSEDNFIRYTSSLIRAEMWFARSIVGASLMKTIDENRDGNLYELSRLCVAYKAYLTAIPTLDVVETSDGFAVIDDAQLSPASTARVKSLMTQIEVNLNEAVDNIQAFLEGSPEHLEQWRECEGCTLLSDTLLPSLTLFQQFGIFTGSRCDYASQRGVLLAIQLQSIAPVISQAYLDFLIEGGNLTSEDKRVLMLVRFALVNLFAKDSDTANSFLMSAREFMIENIDQFPIYKETDCYAKLSFLNDGERVSEGIYLLM